MSDRSKIRCFSIVAHIDHGKSTLADRLIDRAGTVDRRAMREQYLDSMDLERERGITIKASAVRLPYRAQDGEEYILNLIDTPGHVDFSYEVSRALQACEGALLVVDASQGVEAQTIANYHLATDQGLTIIPVINKIDLASADVERVKGEIEDVLELPPTTRCRSRRGRVGHRRTARSHRARLPPPEGDPDAPLQALIFDSRFDPYRARWPTCGWSRARSAAATPFG